MRYAIGLLVLTMVPALSACGDDGSGAPMEDAGITMDDGGGDTDAGPMVDCSDRPAEAPDTRGEVAGALDAERGRILVYGGDTAAPEMCMPRYNLVDEVWAFHLDCSSWERIETTGGPGIRARHAATVDAEGGRLLVFGGRERVGFGEYNNFNDVWAFDFATDTWSEIETTGTAPEARSSAVVAHDATNGRLLVFGGNVSTGGLTLTGVDDMWALDLATGEWSEITATGAPSPRLYHGGVVMGDELFVFGGTPDFDGPYHNDVHAFDMTTDTWREVAADGAAGAPETRFGGDLWADAERGRLIMAMGHDNTAMGNRNDMWAVDVASGEWTQLHPGDTLNGSPLGPCDFPEDFTIPEEGSPERRYSFVRAQEGSTGYMFGGKTDCGNINDVWAIDFATGDWEQLRAATGGEACNRSGATTCTSLCF